MKKMMLSLATFLLIFMLFATLVYSWFTITYEHQVQPVSYDVIRRDVDLNVDFGKNGGSYNSFDEPSEINAYLQNTLPGDIINIRVTVQNSNPIGQSDVDLIIELMNIRSSFIDGDYDLTDFFYIENSEVILTWYDSLTDYEYNNSSGVQIITLDQLSEDIITFQGIPLYNERISNLFQMIEIEGEMTLVNNIPIIETTIASLQVLVIQFNIGFDLYTPSVGGYQDAELLIDGLYVYVE